MFAIIQRDEGLIALATFCHQLIANWDIKIMKNAAHQIQMSIWKILATKQKRESHTLNRLGSEEIVSDLLDAWNIFCSQRSQHVWPILWNNLCAKPIRRLLLDCFEKLVSPTSKKKKKSQTPPPQKGIDGYLRLKDSDSIS
jgi:hypothetical protein